MKTYDEKNSPKDDELTEKEKQQYENFISSSYRPCDDENRFAKDIDGLMEYDYINLSSQNSIQGHNKKRFILLNNGYFEGYINAVKNDKQKTSYISYLNEDDIKIGVYPKQLSALMKKTSYDNFAYNEAISSKIMNFFGVKCVYNCYLKTGKETYIFSLDFLKPNEIFVDFSEFSDIYVINSCGDIRDSLDALEFKADSLKNRIIANYGQIAKIDKQKLKEDYIKTYLVRVLLLGDGDFNYRNSGFIYNVDSNEIMSNPNFDFEYTFAMETNEFGYYKLNLSYIRTNFADIYEEFIENLKQFNKFNKKTRKFVYEDIINSEIFENITLKMYCNNIEQNIDILLNDHYEYISKKQKQ